jgi:hypothetical protein
VEQETPRQPITGIFEPESRTDVLETPIGVGFDKAWQDALDQAEGGWRRTDEETIEVRVELEARLDFWNPGGIGQYRVKITDTGGS